MDIIHPRCAGLDVHAAFVIVCRRILGPGGRVDKVVQRFSTMTADLLAMGDWLAEAGITHVAMASTGVFWKPIWNLLDDRFMILLVNPRDVKQAFGRETDVIDAEWIAQLLQHRLAEKQWYVLSWPLRRDSVPTRRLISISQAHHLHCFCGIVVLPGDMISCG